MTLHGLSLLCIALAYPPATMAPPASPTASKTQYVRATRESPVHGDALRIIMGDPWVTRTWNAAARGAMGCRA
jgi:hypothetical protein